MRNLQETLQLSFLEALILYCLKQLNGERTIYAIYHILNGKKSAQTIQDVHLFGLTGLFKAYDRLSRDQLDSIIKTLISKGHIESNDDLRFFITDKGLEQLQETLLLTPISPYLSGLKYNQASQMLWERLTLLVQVCSHISNKDNTYVPIQKGRQTQLWVKAFLSKRNKSEREKIPYLLLKEFTRLFDGKKDLKPEILVLRLSGYKHAGLTSEQAAHQLCMEEVHYHLEFLGILHFICEMALTSSEAYPIFYELVRESSKSNALTITSLQTYKLLKEGYSIEDIAMFRNLKLSTIEDHIVEIALNREDFSIEPFVSPEEQKKIADIASRTSSRQLRHLRELLGGVSYFKIRLVLARLGDY
ncbi:hypothetical protein AM500_10030 [Bacillus sp. FJAT-18017]|uniref:helix-turn-helix domain-containing protein n=1 Tax=Bacillus sp. FJAT-18017 TaxID=1705566 RepID=UPI0006AEBBD4|nr:helix-turn-helix domain-containing protein [Bacillus sp. FJAT-18017]ALC90083.1 hypothetical protein AM500_10030 [Bacillus sp. FJAT-18017]